ncbi:MAG: FAD-dependent thymidylate synthase [Candidatus Sumerlaeia bacterium]|nr:FAD-dependent thymidylate synthase [Candidatus Sumerlaeia bacterium]
MLRFASAPPAVRLTKAFQTPFRNVVATARTCYSSKGIIDDADVGDRERFSPLAQSIYEAGHHTTFQHAHFQFAIENVSRHFIWGFLHAHPFYNSEQVSQRYVHVRPDTAVVPELPADQDAVYRGAVEELFAAYERLSEMLEGPVESAFFSRFPRSPRREKEQRSAIRKKAQEIARYVLPVATHAYLYHTVSGVTLLRYWRVCQGWDLPSEQRLVVGAMVDELLRFDPNYDIVLQPPLDPERFPEDALFESVPGAWDRSQAATFTGEFDAGMEGNEASKLVGWQENAPAIVAQAVREVLGRPLAAMDDEAAIRLVLDPSQNRLLGESLNLTTHHKLSRALHHAHYVFRKRLSHAADSQDQRHRMTPASRPVLAAHLLDVPDYVTPELFRHDEPCLALYRGTMERLWESIARLEALGAPQEALQYLLPNAATVRFTESADLLNLRHKHTMRLCFNAQEEIWRASREEALQIRDVHPQLGAFLLPPCTQRAMAHSKPICPEGKRYCGVRVWKQDVTEYERII